jgi:hypothetical protein
MNKRYSRKQAEIFDGKNLIKLSFSCSDTAEFTAVKEWVKAIAGRRFGIHFKKAWSIPNTVENIEALMKYGFIFKGDKVTKPKPTPVAQKEETPKTPIIFDKYKDIKLPEVGFEYLYWYQKAALQFLEYVNGQGLIALPPGKGKTYVALHHAKLHPEKLPILIICPATIKIQWSEQARKILSDSDICVLAIGKY